MRTPKKYLLITGMAGLFMGGGHETRAAFELNFQPSPDINAGSQSSESTFARCNMPTAGADAWCHRNQNTPDPDSTPFLREYITVNGISYVHMIVGSLTPDPITGEVFAQETYIRANGAGTYSSAGGKPGCQFQPIQCGGGGVNPLVSGNGQVASSGVLATPLTGDQHTTGIGTGDPTRAIVRQVLKSSEMNQEFLKADFLLKPKITQSINSSDGILSLNFSLDMSSLNYSTNANGALTNTLTLNDPLNPLPTGSGFFDAVASAQSGDVTGGRYTFTAGSGWVDNTVYSSYRAGNPFTGPIVPEDNVWIYDAGSYAYGNGGGAGISNIDWQAYKNLP